MVPAAGTFRQGSWVCINPASAGFLMAAPADTALLGAGLLVQEEAHFSSVYGTDPAGFDSFSSRLGVVQNSKRAIIWSGAGVKIWLRNTPAQTRVDGRAVAAVSMFTPTGLVLGDYIKWNGTTYVEGASEAISVARVTQIDISVAGSEYLEAVLLRG